MGNIHPQHFSHTHVVSGTSQCVPMTPLGEIYEVPQEREGEETHDTAQDGVINTLPNAAYSLV